MKSLIMFALVLCSISAFANNEDLRPLVEPIQNREYKISDLKEYRQAKRTRGEYVKLMVTGKIPSNESVPTASPSADRNADSQTSSGEGSSGRTPHSDSSCQYRGESDYAGCGSK